MNILVNHLGYQEGRPARAILQGADTGRLPDSVQLRSNEGTLLDTFQAGAPIKVEGWKNRVFRVVDFRPVSGKSLFLMTSCGATLTASASFDVVANRSSLPLVSNLLSGLTASRSSGSAHEGGELGDQAGLRQYLVNHCK